MAGRLRINTKSVTLSYCTRRYLNRLSADVDRSLQRERPVQELARCSILLSMPCSTIKSFLSSTSYSQHVSLAETISFITDINSLMTDDSVTRNPNNLEEDQSGSRRLWIEFNTGRRKLEGWHGSKSTVIVKVGILSFRQFEGATIQAAMRGSNSSHVPKDQDENSVN